MDLHENIKKHRKLANLTVSEVVAQMGITEANYYAWEKGKYKPNDKNLKELAKLFKMRVKDFYSDDAESGPETKKPDSEEIRLLIKNIDRMGQLNEYLLKRVQDLEQGRG